jgi:hypothetical protein
MHGKYIEKVGYMSNICFQSTLANF